MAIELGKMARVWENRETNNISLTDVITVMVMKISSMIRHPRQEWVNRIMVLLGEPGIGKSTILKKVLIKALIKATGENWRAKLLHVGSRGMEDNTGLPIITEQQGRKIAGWAAPEQIPGAVHWLNDDGEPAGFTLGIFDELPSATPSVQDQIRELIDGTIPGSGDPVDPRCVYVGAGNPPEAKHITANIIDDAIEKRFKVYAVVPTTEELLQVWSESTLMPDLLYRFLMVNTHAIGHLSPREWEGVGKDALYIKESGGTTSDIMNEMASELQHCPDVVATLRVYFQHGDDPSYYPVRGLKLLVADAQELAELLSIMGVWVGDRNREALLGASINDLQRALKMTDDTELKDNKIASKNVYEVLNFLAASKRADMVKSLIEVVHSTPLVTTVANKMRRSPHLKEMDKFSKRAIQTVQKINAAAGR